MFTQTILIQVGIFMIVLSIAAIIEYIIIKYRDSKK